MIHIYQGFCPDNLEPDNRDPSCPACLVEAERDDLRAEVALLTAEIARIADDYYADYEEDAPLALSEMREALTVLLARKTAVKDEGHG